MTEAHGHDALLYGAGELAPAETAAFEAHLTDCAACRASLALARRGHEWGAALAEGPAPETLARVLVRPGARPWAPVLRWAAVTAFAASAFAVVIVLDRPAPDLSWQSDLPERIRSLQERLDDSRAQARGLGAALEPRP